MWREQQGWSDWSASEKCGGAQVRRKQQRRRVWHAVLDVRMTVLWDTKIPVDSMTQVLSHARKNHVCGSATCPWVWCSVGTSRRFTRESPMCVSETLCNWDWNTKESLIPNLMPAIICLMIATTTKTSLIRFQKGTISMQFSGQLQSLHCTGRAVELLVVELVHWDEVLCCLLQTLYIIALWFWWLRRSRRVGSSNHLSLSCWVPVPNYVHLFCVLPLWWCGSDLRLQLHRSVRCVLRPIRSGSVMPCNLGNSEICPTWSCNPSSFLYGLRRELRDEFFASLCFRDVHREMDLSSSISLESTKHRIDPCLIFALLSKSRKHVPQV